MALAVETLKVPDAVAAGADHVDRPLRRLHGMGLGAHDAGGPGHFLDRFPAHAQRHEESAHLRECGVARHDDIEGELGLAAVERASDAT